MILDRDDLILRLLFSEPGAKKNAKEEQGDHFYDNEESLDVVKKQQVGAELKNVSSNEAVRYGDRWDYSYGGLGMKRFNKDFARIKNFLIKELKNYPIKVSIGEMTPCSYDVVTDRDLDESCTYVSLSYSADKGIDSNKFIEDLERALYKFFREYKFVTYNFRSYLCATEVDDDGNENDIFDEALVNYFPDSVWG